MLFYFVVVIVLYARRLFTLSDPIVDYTGSGCVQ